MQIFSEWKEEMYGRKVEYFVSYCTNNSGLIEFKSCVAYLKNRVTSEDDVINLTDLLSENNLPGTSITIMNFIELK